MSKLVNLDELVNELEDEDTKQRERAQVPQGDENVLYLKNPHSYTGRIIPNKHAPRKTLLTYEEYGFTSRTTGEYIKLGRNPSEVGRKDIIKAFQWAAFDKAKKAGDEEEMKRSYSLFPQRKQMANFYIIDNTDDPELNGQVKALRYSAKVNRNGDPISPIYSRIYTALFGDDKDTIGKRVFDLGPDGVNFVIKVKKKGEWNNYDDSSFKFPSDLGLSDAQIKEIHEASIDLESLLPPVLSDEEIKALLDEHWDGVPRTSLPTSRVSDTDDDDQLDMTPVGASEADLSSDIDDLLSGLEED